MHVGCELLQDLLLDTLGLLQVPHDHGLVLAPRHEEVAVGIDGDGLHPLLVLLERDYTRSEVEVPHLYAFVTRAGVEEVA